MTTPYDADVAIVGGGPAGSTAAILLAQQGYRVQLFEKDQHPRFHIGESLLPKSLPIIDRLGLSDELHAIGTLKPGAEFVDPKQSHTESFYFAESLTGKPPHAYQVKREDFDHMLFQKAKKAGAQTFENTVVTQVDLDHADYVTLTIRDSQQHQRSLKARFLIDASGRDTFLAKKFKSRSKHPKHTSAALFAHYQGAQRLEGDDAGNISILWFEHGWMWFIPLQNDLTSIGIVAHPDYFKQRQGDLTAFFEKTLETVPTLKQRLQNATIARPVTATGNYSYLSNRMYGKNYFMVGDAYAFIDPVFSSGVHIALHSGTRLADTLHQTLQNPNKQKGLFKALQTEIDQGLKRFSWLIFRINTPAIRALFMHPRNHLQLKNAVISLLAGDVFNNPILQKKLKWFKLIYLLTKCRLWLTKKR